MTYWLTAWLAACCPLYMIVYTAYLHCRLQQLPRATKIFIGLQATWRQMLLSAQKICENKRRWLIILRRPHSLLCCSLLSPALRTVRMGIATNDWARLISLKVLSLTMDNAVITKHAWKFKVAPHPRNNLFSCFGVKATKLNLQASHNYYWYRPKLSSRSYWYTEWSAIGISMSSACLSVRLSVARSVVHSGSRGRCTGLKVVPACSSQESSYLSVQTLFIV